MPEKLDPRRFLVELDCLGDEWQRLLPILTEEERGEKRRENSKRVGTILLREIARLDADAYDDDALSYIYGEKDLPGSSPTQYFDAFIRAKNAMLP